MRIALLSFGEIREEVPQRLKLQVFLIVTARLKVVPFPIESRSPS
jgi:hypothetical protein